MKLFLAVVSAVCLTFVAAEEQACGSLERFKIKHQWSEAFGEGHHRVEFGVKLFKNLFHDHPTTKEYFTRVNGDNIYSPEFEAHALRLLAGLDISIGLLDDQAALEAQVAHLRFKHKDRNIKPELYGYLADEILDILPNYLGTRLDYGAWKACLKGLIAGLSA
jgi:hemoglobin-like flavoprotein